MPHIVPPPSPASGGPGARPRLGRVVVIDATPDPSHRNTPDTPAPAIAEHLSRRAAGVDLLSDGLLPDSVQPDSVQPDAVQVGGPAVGLTFRDGSGFCPGARGGTAPSSGLDLVVGLTRPDGTADTAAAVAGRHRARLVVIVQGLAHREQDRITAGLRLADRVAVPSESFRRPLQDWGIDERRISVLPPWGDPAPSLFDRSDARRRLGWPERSFLAVHTGALDPEQDLGCLFEAAALLGPESLVVLAGDGPGRAGLAERARAHPGVLVPAVPDDEHRALALVAADVLLVSESTAGPRLTLPGELARCLGAGRPIVATAPVAGAVAAELSRTGGAGLVVPPGEPARLAGALLALHADPTRRVSMGLAGIAHAESRLSRSAVLARLDGIVDAALLGVARRPLPADQRWVAVRDGLRVATSSSGSGG